MLWDITRIPVIKISCTTINIKPVQCNCLVLNKNTSASSPYSIMTPSLKWASSKTSNWTSLFATFATNPFPSYIISTISRMKAFTILTRILTSLSTASSKSCKIMLLPTTYAIWGKLMFSTSSVILSTRKRGGGCPRTEPRTGRG